MPAEPGDQGSEPTADDLLRAAKTFHRDGKIDEAENGYRRLLERHPEQAEALQLLAMIAGQRGDFTEARQLIERALAIAPASPLLHNNHGLVLQGLGQVTDAIECFSRAIGINANEPRFFFNRALAFQSLNRFYDACTDYDAAIALKPDYIEALNNRGLALLFLRRRDEALASYDRAIALNPDVAEALAGRGRVLNDLQRFEEAAASLEAALARAPKNVEALYQRGRALLALKRFAEAAADFAEVSRLNPNYDYIYGQILFARMSICDWTSFDADLQPIEAGIAAGKRVTRPFQYQAIASSPKLARACSEIFAAHVYPALPPLRQGRRYGHKKIRVGYVSGEFREQATAYLMAGLYERHDKSRFEIHGFDNSGSDGSAMRKRIEASFDSMTDIASLTDRAAADAIAAREIDILVSLNGYFGAARCNVFAQRPAPLQVNYLGFPGTLGAPYMDYILADRRVIPETEHTEYTEEIVYLPDSYQATDNRRSTGSQTPTRRDCGLPEIGFVFCCFNNCYKFTPDVFDVWMRILKHTEGSVLWLLKNNDAMAENLRREAEKQGVAADRLIFAPFVAAEEHLARQKLADLFLDSLPYNAHTTASDALWVGLPILTCQGTAFPGRVAASLLDAIGLPELIARDLREYEHMAIKFARNPATLGAVRDKLAANRKATALFDTERFCRHIEAAYFGMWERHERGKNPMGFAVPIAEISRTDR